MCILLVEDEPLIRELIAESLRDDGFEVMEAEDGPAALAFLKGRSKVVSALVTDYHMPGGINGGQVALETRRAFPGLPVVIATGRPDSLVRSWQTDLAFVLLRKPYLPSELTQILRAAIRPVEQHEVS